MPALTVQTQNTSGVARTNVAVTATHVVPAGATVDPGARRVRLHARDARTRPATGSSALPYGKWTISVAGHEHHPDDHVEP